MKFVPSIKKIPALGFRRKDVLEQKVKKIIQELGITKKIVFKVK